MPGPNRRGVSGCSGPKSYSRMASDQTTSGSVVASAVHSGAVTSSRTTWTSPRPASVSAPTNASASPTMTIDGIVGPDVALGGRQHLVGA